MDELGLVSEPVGAARLRHALWIMAMAIAAALVLGLARPAAAATQDAAAPTAEATVRVTASLEHLPAGTIAQAVGRRFRYLSAQGEVLPPSPMAVPEGGLGDLLPKDLTLIAATSPKAHQVLLRGTPSAVAKAQELLKRMDQKPQQVVLEGTIHTCAPKNAQLTATNGGRIYVLANGSETYEFPAQDRVTGSMRMLTLDLLPALGNVTVGNLGTAAVSIQGTRYYRPQAGLCYRQEVLVLTPRVNGDGTITMTAIASITTGAKELPRTSAVTVNVRSGESFAMALPETETADTGAVMVITPMLVKDEPAK